jgi:deoxyxylulose-5-phosphate synthase
VAGPQHVVLGVPTTYIAHGKPDAILRRLGLDGPGIAASTRAAAMRFSLLPA